MIRVPGAFRPQLTLCWAFSPENQKRNFKTRQRGRKAEIPHSRVKLVFIGEMCFRF